MPDTTEIVRQPWINTPTTPRVPIHMRPRVWHLRMRLDSLASHHDPARSERTSNERIFHRHKHLLPVADTVDLPTQEEIDAICRAFPVPAQHLDIFQRQTLPEFCATILVRMFLANYGGKDGTGIFEGPKRYSRLEARIRDTAVATNRLFEFWGELCGRMQVTDAPSNPTEGSLRIITASDSLSRLVLNALATIPTSIMIAARLWHQEAKEKSDLAHLSFDAKNLPHSQGNVLIDVPAYSANSARHELVREPLLWHLFDALDLSFDEPLASRVALFYNGGDLKVQGSAGVMWLRKEICQRYPGLALLSGSTDRFLLGESNLRIHTWVRCAENNQYLSTLGLALDIRGQDLMQQSATIRLGGRIAGFTDAKAGMPVNFEALSPGTEIVVRFSLTPYAQDLEEGALGAAIQSFDLFDQTFGGQSARGYGLVNLQWVEQQPSFTQEYEEYLAANKEELRNGIIDGTLGTGKVILTEGSPKEDIEDL